MTAQKSVGKTSRIAKIRERVDDLLEGPMTAALAKRRFTLLRQALRYRDPYLVWSLADAYNHGLGCPISINRAIKYHELAAELGQSAAMTSLGVIYFQERTPPDIPRAIAFYKAAAKKGERHAFYNLALCYVDGTGVRRNIAKSLQYLKRAADAGHPRAMVRLALAILDGTTKAEGRDPMLLIRMAADAGDETAAFTDEVVSRLRRRSRPRRRAKTGATLPVSRETRKSVTP